MTPREPVATKWFHLTMTHLLTRVGDLRFQKEPAAGEGPAAGLCLAYEQAPAGV